MPKQQLSIGTDTPTGEPASAPAGPYTTDEVDDITAPPRRSRHGRGSEPRTDAAGARRRGTRSKGGRSSDRPGK